jgi:hypothetical protein
MLEVEIDTNIGQLFLKLIDKHLTANQPLSKIIDWSKTLIQMHALYEKNNCKISRQTTEYRNKKFKKDKQGVIVIVDVVSAPWMGVEKVVHRAMVAEDDRTVNTYTSLTGQIYFAEK